MKNKKAPIKSMRVKASKPKKPTPEPPQAELKTQDPPPPVVHNATLQFPHPLYGARDEFDY